MKRAAGYIRVSTKIQATHGESLSTQRKEIRKYVEREKWELFTSLEDSHSWVNESLKLQEENPDSVWPIIWNYTLWDVIHGYDEWDKEVPGLEGTNLTGKHRIWKRFSQ